MVKSEDRLFQCYLNYKFVEFKEKEKK